MQAIDLAALLLAALPATGPLASDWERVAHPLTLDYPRDHGAHYAHAIEWWYLTGQLEAEDGRRFGFQFTIFRQGLEPGRGEESGPWTPRHVLAGHLAVTDIDAQRTRFAERLRRESSPFASASDQDLELDLDDWSLVREAGGTLRLECQDALQGIELELELTPRKPLVRHGEQGYSSKGSEPGNASAYVSWTRMEARGRSRVAGQSVEVHGSAWFDHEYGTSVLEDGARGWDWFGLQLEDGRELMAFVLRDEEGQPSAVAGGTLVDARGVPRGLDAADFSLRATSHWTSPRSAARYPASWRLELPDEQLALTIEALVPDCELSTERSTGVAYWEGPVAVSGSASGRGYAELTGYAGSMQGRF